MVYRSVLRTRCINAADCPYITMLRDSHPLSLVLPLSLSPSRSLCLRWPQVSRLVTGGGPVRFIKILSQPSLRRVSHTLVPYDEYLQIMHSYVSREGANHDCAHSSSFAGVGARYETPFSASKWTSSSLERPSSRSRKMNRVKAGDTWARVSTKRYGSRLDGNEARIESLLLFLPRWFSYVPFSSNPLLPRGPFLYYPGPTCSV